MIGKWQVSEKAGMLAVGLGGLLLINIWAWSIYWWVGRTTSLAVREPAIEFAEGWLRRADAGNMSDCRFASKNPEKWFDLFIADRQSLGELVKRRLHSKQPFSRDGYAGVKLIYSVNFDMAPQAWEIVWLANGRSGWKVCQIDYGFRRLPYLGRGKYYTGNELPRIRAIIRKGCKSFDKADFKALAEMFSLCVGISGRSYLPELRRFRQKRGAPKIRNLMTKIKYWKGIPGRTRWELIAASNRIVCKVGGRKYTGNEYLMLKKDNYQSNREWQLCSYKIGNMIKQK